MYLKPKLNEQFKHTDQAQIETIYPHQVYNNWLAATNEYSDLKFGLEGSLQKMYGGRIDQTYAQIASSGATDLRRLFDRVLRELEDSDGLDGATKDLLASNLARISEIVAEQSIEAGGKLDEQACLSAKDFGSTTSLGPNTLNNIEGPGILSKIWTLIERAIGDPRIDLDTFFGIRPHDFEEDAGRERSTVEKINAIYHQLNFIGYYRDSDMKKERRFVASFSDMTHAGLAAFCHLLLSRDIAFIKKTKVAYEHLGVATKILALKEK